MDCEERNGDRCYLVGEEEAIWLLRLVLPYVNEVLQNLRSLFSGEPSTTMKVGTMKKGNCMLLSIGKGSDAVRNQNTVQWYCNSTGSDSCQPKQCTTS
jgi:hypothetical protein